MPAVQTVDPNALYGPTGYGASSFISGADQTYPYLITFENSPSATAPSQDVTLTDQLDPNLNWSTFQLTGITFGSTTITIPAGSQYYQTTVPMTYDGTTFEVEVEAGIHTATGQVYATFQCIDPLTGLPPANALVRFLPPEDGTGRGEGSLSYTVSPVANLPTGTEIRNVADITFDGGVTIATDLVNDEQPSQGIDPTKQALITIDSGAPTSTVAILPQTETSTAFTVSWSGTDDAGGSGIAFYSVYDSTDGGSFTPWLTSTTSTTATYLGAVGNSYAFYSVATDNVGNVQPTPTSAQASTVVSSTASHPVVLTGSAFYLQRDADGQHLDVWDSSTDTGTPAQSISLSSILTLTVNGSPGGTSITVDFTYGDPLPLTGLNFLGVAGAVNALDVTGTSGNDAVTVNGTTVSESAAFGLAGITYSNLSSITFSGGTGSDTLTQTAQPGNGATLTFVGPTSSDSLNVSAGTYTFAAGAAGSKIQTITLGSLSIGAGAKVSVAHSNGHPNRAVLVLGGLTIAGSNGALAGTLDLADNDLDVEGGSLSTITSLIRSGYNYAGGANWNGTGIISSAAASDSNHLTTLGVVSNNISGGLLYGGGTTLGLFDGVNPGLTDVLVKYTYAGDANLDGKVDGSDYSLIDAGYAAHATGWYAGDFSYDGVVDGSDYTLVDNAFNNQGIQLNSISPILTLPSAPTLTYDGTSDVTSWVVPTLAGVAGKPAPTGSAVVTYYAGTTTTGTPLASPPVLAGTYTVVASYAGDPVYAADLSNTVTFTIGRATPTLTLTPAPATIKYDGTADETAWVKTVLTGITGALVPTGAVTISYYSGTTTTGPALSSPPTAVGIYTAIANYAGDSNYLPTQSSTVTFTISATTGATPLALAGSPSFYLRLDADGQHLDVWDATTDTGSPNQSVLLSNVSSIAVTGAPAGTTLVVDFGAGEPLVPSGLTFTGASGAANTLDVVDTGDTTDLSFNVDSANIDVVSPAFLAPVTYANVKTINITPGTGIDTLTQLAQPGGTLTFLNTTSSDSVRVVNGTYTIPAGEAGTGIHSDTLNNLTLVAGTKVVVASPPNHADRAVVVLNNLVIAGSTGGWLGQLDLSGNDLVVHNGNLSQITSMISGGYNEAGGANWNGQGIASSAAASDTAHLPALGIELNNDGKGNRLFGTGTSAGLFDNQNTVLTDVLVKYTYFGDANLDGKVDGTDYARLDTGSNSDDVLTGWANGDFNYDGAIDGTDLGLLDNSFNGQGASLK